MCAGGGEMKRTTDERIGLLSLVIASVVTGLITHNGAVGFAVLFALFGSTLAIKSWLDQIYQALTETTKERS